MPLVQVGALSFWGYMGQKSRSQVNFVWKLQVFHSILYLRICLTWEYETLQKCHPWPKKEPCVFGLHASEVKVTCELCLEIVYGSNSDIVCPWDRKLYTVLAVGLWSCPIVFCYMGQKLRLHKNLVLKLFPSSYS